MPPSFRQGHYLSIFAERQQASFYFIPCCAAALFRPVQKVINVVRLRRAVYYVQLMPRLNEMAKAHICEIHDDSFHSCYAPHIIKSNRIVSEYTQIFLEMSPCFIVRNAENKSSNNGKTPFKAVRTQAKAPVRKNYLGEVRYAKLHAHAREKGISKAPPRYNIG